MPGILNTFYNAEPTAGLIDIAGGASVESAYNMPAVAGELQPYNKLTSWDWWGAFGLPPKKEDQTQEENPVGSEGEKIPVIRGGVTSLDYFWTGLFVTAAILLATKLKKGGA